MKKVMIKEVIKRIISFVSLKRILFKAPFSNHLYLTFDDGPNPVYTPQILSILKYYALSATFFVRGSSASDNPSLLEKIRSDGHSIGNHTYNHIDLSKCDLSRTKKEIKACKYVLEDNLLLRPPFGRIKMFNLLCALLMRYKIIFWSIDSLDYKKLPSEQIINNVLQEQPVAGDVILFHDDNEETVKALPVIIESLLAKGSHFGKL